MMACSGNWLKTLEGIFRCDGSGEAECLVGLAQGFDKLAGRHPNGDPANGVAWFHFKGVFFLTGCVLFGLWTFFRWDFGRIFYFSGRASQQ
jgi:hypothetical protein